MARLLGWSSLFVVTVFLALALPAGAADDPANVVKYRQTVMQSIGAHIGGIAAVVKGEVSYGPRHVAEHARGINASAKLITDAFKPNTGMTGPTIAKADIWTDWDTFAAAAKRLEEESAKMIEVAVGGDMAAIGAQLGALGSACGGCHNKFREKKG